MGYMDIKTGFIGYFDILGYQNLLEKNEPEDIAKTVIPLLTGFGKDLHTSLKLFSRSFGDVSKVRQAQVDEVVKSIEWMVFSDTILLSMPLDEKDNDKLNVVRWVEFIMACSFLYSEMFRNGLPIRGVINHGKYFIQDTCFAGRIIVEAYQLSNNLEISACVLTDSAYERAVKINQSLDEDLNGIFITEYMVPEKERETLRPVLKVNLVDDQEDITNRVLKSFWGHNKDIHESVQKKIKNTEQWIRYIKMKDKS
jgi:hypothetical protein